MDVLNTVRDFHVQQWVFNTVNGNDHNAWEEGGGAQCPPQTELSSTVLKPQKLAQ